MGQACQQGLAAFAPCFLASALTTIPFWAAGLPPGEPMSQIKQTVDSTDRVVTIEMSGDIVDQDLLNLAGEIEKIPGMQPDFSVLIDLRRAKGWRVTSAGVRLLAEQTPVLSGSSRRAVVVPSRFGYGMARMYELLRHDRGVSMRVFYSYDKAKRWVTEGR